MPVKFVRELQDRRPCVLVQRDILSDQREHVRSRFVASHLAWSPAVLAAKAAVEIREVAEANVVGDDADRGLTGAQPAQQPVCPRQALPHQEFREGRAVRFEQALHISRRDVEVGGESPDRQIAPMAMRNDIGFRELQAATRDGLAAPRFPYLEVPS